MSIDTKQVESTHTHLLEQHKPHGDGPHQHRQSIFSKLVFIALFASSMIVCAAAAGSNSRAIRATAPKGVTEAFYTCIDKADQNLTEAGICITKEREYQDARLNKVYKQLLEVLDGKSKDNLVAAEKAWTAFKDKDGAFMTTLYGTEAVDNLELEQSNVFRLCERANTLERHLLLAKD